jgi:predicted RNase H-like HicB family nuclease
MPNPPTGFSLAIEYHREEDGRWLADIPVLAGVTAYGRTRKQATVEVQALALAESPTDWSMARSPAA